MAKVLRQPRGDETLTLSTFLPDDAALRTQLDWTSPWATTTIDTQVNRSCAVFSFSIPLTVMSRWEEYIATVNFESPFATSGYSVCDRPYDLHSLRFVGWFCRDLGAKSSL